MNDAPRHDSSYSPGARSEWRQRIVLLLTGLVLASVLITFLVGVVSRRSRGAVQLLVQSPQISSAEAVTNQVLVISNSTPHTVSVCFTFQIRSNGGWVPAAESLYDLPRHPLTARSTVGFMMPEPPTNVWRFAVLQQRSYAENWLGGLAEYMDRRLSSESSRKDAQRGASDIFLFTGPLRMNGSVASVDE